MDTYDELFEQMDIIRKMHEDFREFVKAGYGNETLEKLEMCSLKNHYEGQSNVALDGIEKKNVK